MIKVHVDTATDLISYYKGKNSPNMLEAKELLDDALVELRIECSKYTTGSGV